MLSLVTGRCISRQQRFMLFSFCLVFQTKLISAMLSFCEKEEKMLFFYQGFFNIALLIDSMTILATTLAFLTTVRGYYA
jgi:hypothetical protein